MCRCSHPLRQKSQNPLSDASTLSRGGTTKTRRFRIPDVQRIAETTHVIYRAHETSSSGCLHARHGRCCAGSGERAKRTTDAARSGVASFGHWSVSGLCCSTTGVTAQLTRCRRPTRKHWGRCSRATAISSCGCIARGAGLSSDQGVSAGDQMTRARQAGGSDARNRVQLQLLDHEEMNEATAALARLRARGDVDAGRIGLVGHSFGGSLAILMAAQDPTIRAVVIFGGAAGSWNQSSRPARAPPCRGGTPLGGRALHSCEKRLLDGARPGACDRDATAWKTLGGEDLSAVRRGRARRAQSHLRIGVHMGIGRLRVSGRAPATASKDRRAVRTSDQAACAAITWVSRWGINLPTRGGDLRPDQRDARHQRAVR